MRLTADVLLRIEGHLNVVRERELNVRGFQVATIENLAVLEDQYDCLDFTNNDIKRLDNFPLMKRVTTLLFSNNHISKLSSSIAKNLPGLQCIVLSNNRIAHLYELRALAKCTKLEHVALLDNPVCMHPHYRLFLVFHLCCLREDSPHLGKGGFRHGVRSIDYRKVTAAERAAARQLFESQVGRELLEALKQEHSSGQLIASSSSSKNSVGAHVGTPAPLTDEQKRQIRRAIDAAHTKEDVDRIELQLQTGTFPFLSEAADVLHGAGPFSNDTQKSAKDIQAATDTDVAELSAAQGGSDQPEDKDSAGQKCTSEDGPPVSLQEVEKEEGKSTKRARGGSASKIEDKEKEEVASSSSSKRSKKA